MTPFAIGAVAWAVLCVAIALVVGKCIALGETVPTDDADWLADAPADCLGQDEIDERFRLIVGARSTREWTA